jgi:hypothetical protein
MAAKQCEEYPRSRVEELWAGRETLTAEEIAALDIRVEDRLWAIIACYLDDRQRLLFACDCADQALRLVATPDPRSVEAVAVARLYAVGEATFEQLVDAMVSARYAANAATSSAFSVASSADVWDASSAASSAAFRAATSAALFTARAAAWDASEAAWNAWKAARSASDAALFTARTATRSASDAASDAAVDAAVDASWTQQLALAVQYAREDENGR